MQPITWPSTSQNRMQPPSTNYIYHNPRQLPTAHPIRPYLAVPSSLPPSLRLSPLRLSASVAGVTVSVQTHPHPTRGLSTLPANFTCSHARQQEAGAAGASRTGALMAAPLARPEHITGPLRGERPQNSPQPPADTSARRRIHGSSEVELACQKPLEVHVRGSGARAARHVALTRAQPKTRRK